MCRKLIYLISLVLVLGLTLTSPADAELVGWWRFDEGSGTVASDGSGYGNDGTIQGGPQWVTGRLNKALQLDGVDDNVEVPHADILTVDNEVTIMAWINAERHTNPGTNWQGIMAKGGNPNRSYSLYTEVGQGLHFSSGSPSVGTVSSMDVPLNEWVHVCAQVINGGHQYYINGEDAGSGGSGIVLPGTSDTATVLLGDARDDNREMLGMIDDVRIYNHALTQQEVQDAMLGSEGQPYAMNPSPEDGALLTEFMMGILGTTLTWKSGDFAESHNVYFGDDFDAVNNGTGGTFNGNQSDTYLLVGYGYMPNDPVPDGFVPGTTYYWRIDEVNDTDPNSPWKGDVWSFSLPPTKAHEPAPTDGSAFQDPNVDLSWELGFGGAVQTVYFGEDYDAVNDGTIQGVQVGSAAYDPGTLEYDTTYYWRVETFGGYGLIKGDVWSLKTTLPGLGTIVLERWNNFPGTVPELRNFWKYPNDPDEVETLSQFSWDQDLSEYGARIYGWVYAPATGDYTFWLCTDDNGELWLSTDDDSSNTRLVAQESSYRGPNSWGTGEEQSEPISLVAGNKYYIEALWEEGGGGDHCMVAWRGPGVEGPTIIPGNNLSPYRPLKAFGAKPSNRATGVTQTPVLEWKPGIQAASHEVYFGTDEDAVRNATKTSPEYIGPRTLGNESYDPGKLAWESTFYWRVDEVNNTNPDSPWVGGVWNFTTADYAIVDDFEDYNITDKQIWAIWHDGFGYWDFLGVFHPGNGTGSGVGDEDNDATYMEETIVNNGNMSMPYFYNNNDPTKMKYSEAKKTLIKTRDWTEGGVKALSLWFQGIPGSVGSFTDNFDGTYTMTGSGADIWNVPDYTGAPDGYYHDEFHYAYKPLAGAGSIIARVDSLQNTASSAKAGVMIRETLDANSVHVMMVVTPTDGVKFERRPTTGFASAGDTVAGITAPQWVKLERDLGGFYTASYSDDGLSWTVAGVPEPIGMGPNAFIGLVVTSHDAALTCQAEFSNVQLAVSGPWANQDIGIQSNEAERMYVAISNSNGTTGTVYYEDNDNIVTDATQIDTWTEFNIDLKDFQDQGVNLADVNSVTVGIGTRGNTTPGGAGKVYIDDIRLYRPRYVPGKGTPIASDITADGVVDYRDLEIMSNEWLNEAETPSSANMIAQYNFENNLLDSAGNNNGTAMGSPTYSPGIDGQAIDLDGIDDYVETNKTPSDLGIGGGAAKTIVAWAYTRSFNDGGIFDMGDNLDGQNFSLRTMATTNVWRVQRWGYPTYDFDFTYPSLDEWVHFALVYDGSDAGNESRAYADGVLVGTQTIELDTTDTRTFAIGVWSGNYFDGLIDDLRVYGRALSSGEIISLAGGSAVDLNDDMEIDFKDYTVLADQWLGEQLWPEW
ncbi:MAG: LamG-like jellyroll fold domain-containing protein [Planctomycetota bacterium]|jgi:hypothetical protein